MTGLRPPTPKALPVIHQALRRVDNRVEIQLKQGKKSPDDKIILVANKSISLLDLLKIVQAFANNEKRVNQAKILKSGRFFFREATYDDCHRCELGTTCAGIPSRLMLRTG